MVPEERFWYYAGKCDMGCWEWEGPLDEHGYGLLSVGEHRRVPAHRYAYEMLVGPYPAGHHLMGLFTLGVMVGFMIALAMPWGPEDDSWADEAWTGCD